MLLFTLFDLLLAGALGLTLLGLTRRWLTSLFAGVSMVLVVYVCSKLKLSYTLMPAQASDLLALYSAWPAVKSYAWPMIILMANVVLIHVVFFVREKPIRLPPAAAALLAGTAGSFFVACAFIDDRLSDDDGRLMAGPYGPKIAVFYRSVYRWPSLQEPAQPAAYRAGTDLFFEGKVKPNIVVVLQESTFQPGHIKGQEPARNFLFEGSAPLVVNVRGSGTWVEEYAVLHGVPPPFYGEHYMLVNLLGPAVPLRGKIAPLLQGQGYDTTSVYPTAGNMLGAATYHKSLGIRTFISCTDIPGCLQAKDWRQTPDALFFNRVLEILRSSDKPQFVFTGTIRQHSPHVDKFPQKLHRGELIQEYRRRLALSSTEAQDFISKLADIRRPTIVLMYGDHIPADVVASYGEEDFDADTFETFFNLYDSTGKPRAAAMIRSWLGAGRVSSSFLDALLLKFAGFSGEYVDTKLRHMRGCRGQFCDNHFFRQDVTLSTE